MGLSWVTPIEVMKNCANRMRQIRIEQRITQTELAARTGVAVGTIKRFEHTGEIQFSTLLNIALVLNKLDDFNALFQEPDIPASLYHESMVPERQRARKK